MRFEFIPQPGFDFLNAFSEQFNVPLSGDELIIPKEMGEGSIRRVQFSAGVKMIVHHYILKQDFELTRVGTAEPGDLVSVIFHSNETAASLVAGGGPVQLSGSTDFAVQIASTDLNSDIRFAAHSEVFFTVLGVDRSVLRGLLAIDQPNRTIETILTAGTGFLFYERMTPDFHKILKQLTLTNQSHDLRHFRDWINVQQLLYLLFEVLQKRGTAKHNMLHKQDAERLMLVRTAVLSDLSVPPRLAELARMAGMSETKLKDQFKQVFGDSIYNYFQKARMEEAAFLLRHSGKSVSEIGYSLGFVNLSHFSRLFEKMVGLKPKKYASGG
ncbi:helix-turn-helix domain-containing protein [Dyadobacter crusticola]|uniref:helix-turn-helix domain-containing protein n=1 Tax=Dyadobacter crusticola TaxID=292407 RepID=UPI0004E1DB06|nr:AraC family transcriptional regulator [Dyadobacter crusticola]